MLLPSLVGLLCFECSLLCCDYAKDAWKTYKVHRARSAVRYYRGKLALAEKKLSQVSQNDHFLSEAETALWVATYGALLESECVGHRTLEFKYAGLERRRVTRRADHSAVI